MQLSVSRTSIILSSAEQIEVVSGCARAYAQKSMNVTNFTNHVGDFYEHVYQCGWGETCSSKNDNMN